MEMAFRPWRAPGLSDGPSARGASTPPTTGSNAATQAAPDGGVFLERTPLIGVLSTRLPQVRTSHDGAQIQHFRQVVAYILSVERITLDSVCCVATYNGALAYFPPDSRQS